ncbi:MAG: hypothetical protein E7612_11270 [Ruminococcaceae bacterium]|nr:hypothetical protein [Oscillospiraceae bacterium]
MLNSVKRAKIFEEFTSEEQEYHFGIKEKAVSHHIDTLYYSVYLKDDKPNVEHDGIIDLLYDLNVFKTQKKANPSEEVVFHNLSVSSFGAAVGGGLYGYRLTCEERFDIFISDYLPNEKTPRIQVQLRTYSLILDGLYGAINKSFDALDLMLRAYDISILEVTENRIDYAFHTNLIQKPITMFCDESLSKHLVCSLRDVYKHMWITTQHSELFDLDYFALGSRRSNNVFFRTYAKAKEVVQMNYKAFFFEFWRTRGLISRYDLYVYQTAYEMKSFKTGCLVGRIKWYLENGKNHELKEKLEELLKSCNINSENNPYMEKQIKGILPEPTVILNVEFETKRKFYHKCDHFISCYDYKHECSPALHRLYKILDLRREFITKLMTEVIEFTEDRLDLDSPPMDWWKRLRRVRIDDQPDKAVLDVWYSYSRGVDEKRSERMFMRNLAQVGILSRNDTRESTFGEDLWDFVTNYNDNDIHTGLKESFLKLDVSPYKAIQKKKARQLTSLLDKNKS